MIAGPSCVGKSTLIARLRAGELPSLAARLGLTHDSPSVSVNVSELTGFRDLPVRQAVIHCCLAAQQHSWPEVTRALNTTDRADFLTLWESPDQLLRRGNKRFGSRVGRDLMTGRLPKARTAFRRLQETRHLFTHPAELWRLYTRWLGFCRQFDGSAHWIVRSLTPERPTSLDGWSLEVPFWDKTVVR